jgi:putative integral membrane protein (TIGR02587 family)
MLSFTVHCSLFAVYCSLFTIVMKRSRTNSWAKELDDLIRAFSGAFLFGTPLLWTMEMWWIGTFVELWKLLIFLVLAFAVNVHLTYFAGFKEQRTFHASLTQAVEAVAVGVVTSVIVLLVLNRISLGDPLDTVLGKVAIQAIPLSIGASAANALLAMRNNGGEGDDEEPEPDSPWRAVLNDLGATIAGGIFIGFSIAPTAEIPTLAAELGYWHEIALVGLSLLVTYAIVFESDFSPQRRQKETRGLFQRPITETVMAYFVSLFVALVALYLFDQFEISDPIFPVISQVLVLGLPTAVGGAAGRVVI